MSNENNVARTGTPRAAWIVAAILLIVGIPAWVMQMLAPQFGEGFVTWGLNIDLFFLFAGIGAALLALVCTARLTQVLPAVRESSRFFALVSAACLITACLVVFLDAGRPLRVFEIVFRPQLDSLFVWDFYAITLSIVLAVALALGAKGKALAVAGTVCGLAVLTVEGCILAVCTGTPMWHGNNAIPVLFIAEGVLAAGAVVMLFTKNALKQRALVTGTIALLGLVLLINMVEVLVGGYLGSGFESTAIGMILTGSLAPLFWLQILVGIAAPTVLIAMRHDRTARIASAALILIGVFMGKLMILLSGQAVLATGDLAAYAPSAVEISACLGYVGLALMIIFIGRNILEKKGCHTQAITNS